MLYTIVILSKCRPRVIRRVNKYALNLTRKILFQRLERQQIVPVNQHIVEDVVFTHAVFGVVALVGVVQQDAGL